LNFNFKSSFSQFYVTNKGEAVIIIKKKQKKLKNILKKIINNYFKSFSYFYKYLGFKVIISVTLCILVGFLDSIGLSMLMPLFTMFNESQTVDTEKLGNLKYLTDGLQSLGFTLNLVTILVFISVFFSLKGIAQYFRSAYQVILQQQFIKKIRLSLISYFSQINYKYFVTADAGRIQNTLSGEVDKVARAYQTYFTALQFSIFVIVYMASAFLIDYKFAILVSIGGLLTNLIYKKLYAKTKGASRELTSENHVFQSLIIQRVANFKYLKATGSDKLFSKKLISSVDLIEKNNRRIGILASVLTGSREPLLILVVMTVIYIQIIILKGSLGPIIMSLLFFYKALNALMMVQTQTNLFLAVSGSLQNMTDFTQELKDNKEQTGIQSFRLFQERIQLLNVSFGYQPNDFILKNIDLEIKKNQTIAFVGESGSGKTTLVNMIAGLIQNDKGTICIDGKDMKELDITTYQNRIGYITQDPVIFNDSVFNNITFWDEQNEINIKKFNIAVSKASIADFIESMEFKEQSILGNSGINLSGGQKQRISIARELYKEIDILILDEATSALDSETERLIQNNIDELKGNYTVLIVAHRLSTIKNADKIVFMNKGKIEMVDDFESLLQRSESFNRMVKLQEL